MSGRFYFFLNRGQALGFGHMGWGYAEADGSFRFGSTDHKWDIGSAVNWADPNAFRQAVEYAKRYLCLPRGGFNDFWMGTHRSESGMLAAMRDGNYGGKPRIPYQECKVVKIDKPDPSKAAAKAASLAGDGWCLIDRNCLDHSTAVAAAYGVGWNNVWPLPGGPMPWKQTNWWPNRWFDELLKEERPIRL